MKDHTEGVGSGLSGRRPVPRVCLMNSDGQLQQLLNDNIFQLKAKKRLEEKEGNEESEDDEEIKKASKVKDDNCTVAYSTIDRK